MINPRNLPVLVGGGLNKIQILFILILFSFYCSIYGQENIDAQLRNNRNQLEKIKNQINNSYIFLSNR